MASLRVVLRVPRQDSPPAEDTSVRNSSAYDDLSGNQCQPPQPSAKKMPRLPPKKKRKSSYHVRKEAMHELRDQEEALRAQLQELKASEMDRNGSSLRRALRDNRALNVRVGVNRLAIAGIQTLNASFAFEKPPLGDYIHLPRDPDVRREILHDLKAPKLDAALRLLLARAQSQNLRRRTRQIDTFETENGDHVVLDWGVAKFEQPGLTVEMVYDEVMYFSQTHELAQADKLGVITIRESEICPDVADVTQVRTLSTHGPNHLLETNFTYFTQYFGRAELLEQPHGLIVFDYVDQDDLYPYQPLTRLRKDISMASMVLQCPPATSSPHETPAIALVHWSYGRVHKSSLVTEDELLNSTRKGVCFDLMVQTVRERLAWKAF